MRRLMIETGSCALGAALVLNGALAGAAETQAPLEKAPTETAAPATVQPSGGAPQAPPPPTASESPRQAASTDSTPSTSPVTSAPTASAPGSVVVPPSVIHPASVSAKPATPVVVHGSSAKDTGAPAEEAEVPADIQHLGNFQNHWQVSLGMRVAWITDPSFDPFSDRNAVTQGDVGAARTLLAKDALSLVGVAFLDVGSEDSTVRGQRSSLHLTRISLGPEVRYHLIPRSYVFARILPVYTVAKARLRDDATNTTLKDTNGAFGGDVSAGVAYNFFGSDGGQRQQARFWLIGEGGYGLGNLAELRLAAKDEAGVPARVEPVSLSSISLSGAFMRVAAAATF